MDARRLVVLSLSCAALTPFGAGALDVELVNRTGIVSAIDSNGPSDHAVGITPDGRYTLFTSLASNLIAGDTNRGGDLFLHDANADSVERVTIGTAGAEADGVQGTVAGISDDGRYVVFDSTARNLVAMSTFGYRQIYLRDRIAGTTTLLSRFSGGNAAMADSANPQLSADGRYVVFDSVAAFDSKDTNGVRDVYRLDRQNGTFTLISVSDDGRIGNNVSYEPQISADGSSVVFYTWAMNLVVGDTNNVWDLLLRKPAAGTTQRVSVNADGSQQMSSYPSLPLLNAISGDGRFVIMNTHVPLEPADTNDSSDGYLYDNQDGSVRRVTLGAGNAQIGGYSSATGLSRDAARIVFQAHAPDVVAGQPAGNYRAYVRELASGTNTHVTFRSGGEIPGDDVFAPVMSDDGGIVVASTLNSNFVGGDDNGMTDLIRQDGATNPAQRLSSPLAGATTTAANHDSGAYFQGHSASAGARFVAFGSLASNLVPGDLNGVHDVFVRDRLLGTTERVSVHSNGSEGFCGSFGPSISDDGRYVVFYSCTPFDIEVPALRMDIYRHDRLTHTTALVSRAHDDTAPNSFSTNPSLSADGRFVAFASCASDIVQNDVNGYCDIFVRDLDAGTTMLATPAIAAGGADQHTTSPRISRNGQRVFYTSDATNLAVADTNAAGDVFVFDRGTQSVELVSANAQGGPANGHSFFADVTDDGSQVLFSSMANNLVGDITPAGIYVRDLDTDTTELVSRNSVGEPLGFAVSPAAISADGGRVVFVTSAANAGPPEGFKLMLFERTPARLSLVRTMNARFPFSGEIRFVGDSTLLLSSADNTYVADDANNHFTDVFLFGKIEDHLFANGFQSP
jgi:Tol biopolymer transport system component